MDSNQSIIYKNTFLYSLVMRILYTRNFNARYQVIVDLIPAGCSVVDVCAGDCYLYRKFLRQKHIQYTALDISPHFIRSAQKLGINARLFNARTGELPRGDVLIMQGSLYQFLPNADAILGRMISAARVKVIIAEPVQNLSSSKNALVARLAKNLTRPNDSAPNHERFCQESLQNLFCKFTSFEQSFLIPGGREMVGVFSPKTIGA